MAQISFAEEKVQGTRVIFSSSTSAERSKGWEPALLGHATIADDSPEGECKALSNYGRLVPAGDDPATTGGEPALEGENAARPNDIPPLSAD